MQVGVLGQIKNAAAIKAAVGEVLEAAREGGVRVFFLRHLSLPKELMGVIVGVATEIGVEPTVRHGADLGYVPIVVTDACGAGHEEAGARALASLRYIGDAIVTDAAEICDVLRRKARG
jgi:nicotinamidase-related amidase